MNVHELQNRFKNAASAALETTAQSMVTALTRRVFEKGIRTDGEAIGKGTRHKDGTHGVNYSTRYAFKRAQKGLQIGFIDLTFTGELKRSLFVQRQADGAFIIKINGRNSYKADRLDEMKGVIFEAQTGELAAARRKFKKELVKRLNLK